MFLDAPGRPTSEAQLRSRLALQSIKHLKAGGNPGITCLEVRRASGQDILVLDVMAEVPSCPVHPILPVERIALCFDRADERMPRALALRQDFPEVPHLNLEDTDLPRSLCLYEMPFDDLRHHLTGAQVLHRLQQWLALSSMGKLHQQDQPLEPLLGYTPDYVILNPSRYRPGLNTLEFAIYQDGLGRSVLLPSSTHRDSTTFRVISIVVETDPVEHGVIRHLPKNLEDLARLLSSGGIDLINDLRRHLGQTPPEYHDHRLMLICLLNRKRSPSSAAEYPDIRAFLTEPTIAAVGEDLGIWAVRDGVVQSTLDPSRTGGSTTVKTLNPLPTLTPDGAAEMNGFKKASPLPILAVGAGALGSQVILNAARAGFGHWTVVDEDLLLPHNLARHALGGGEIGFSKANSLAEWVNRMFDGEKIVTAIYANVLRPSSTQQSILEKAYREAQLILDMSASVSVARHIAHRVTGNARKAALFLNPSGRDLILLAENPQKTLSIDQLEMLYYQWLLDEIELADHIAGAEKMRYGLGCRDVSITLRQDFVALHAAIGASAIMTLAASENVQVSLWRLEPASMTIRRFDLFPEAMEVHRYGEWTLHLSAQVKRQLLELREQALPNETGGTLVGAYDQQSKSVYVTSAVPSPGDSEEYPNSYIRGSAGLRKRYKEISELTAGMLQYIGEWHSHPQGVGVLPSSLDRKLFDWLTMNMASDGLPPLMIIVGEADLGVYLNRLN